MNMTNRIPFLDLITPHQELKEQLLAVFEATLDTGGFIGGQVVEDFERDFATFCDSRHCVGLGSGTDALRFALIAAGVKQGDVVITVPNTFIATAEAISQAGARPAFIDVDERTYNMAPEKLFEYLETKCINGEDGRPIERATGRRVSAVVPVHLYGQACDMDPIMELAERYNLIVIEDACQAHGAEYFSRRENRWRKAGSMGVAAAFSFYPGKNLGACGEGGAVTTANAEIAQRVRMLRDHGQARKYYHDIEGYNGRLDALQAGILRVKLAHLSMWNEQRRQSALRYRELFSAELGCEVGLPFDPPWTKPVHHLYVVQVDNPILLQRHLADVNIGTGVHYPVPLHLQKAYVGLGYSNGDFPVSEKAAAVILSLPMYPGLNEEQQRRVVEHVREFTAKTLMVATAFPSNASAGSLVRKATNSGL